MTTKRVTVFAANSSGRHNRCCGKKSDVRRPERVSAKPALGGLAQSLSRNRRSASRRPKARGDYAAGDCQSSQLPPKSRMAAQAAGGRPLKGNEYATAGAFRRALQDRLAATAKSEGVDLRRIRRQVAFDRLLARLFSSTNPPWVLKGGYALELKFATARTTKDIDLGLDQLPGIGDNWNQRAGQLLAILQERAALVMDDFFEFIIGEPASELDAAPYGGGRFPVETVLDGRTFAKFHLDIGAGDLQREPPEFVRPRDWLAFAGIPTAVFPIHLPRGTLCAKTPCLHVVKKAAELAC